MPGRGCDDVMPGTCYCGAASVRINMSTIKHNNFSHVSRIIKTACYGPESLFGVIADFFFLSHLVAVSVCWSLIVCVSGNRWQQVEDWPKEV